MDASLAGGSMPCRYFPADPVAVVLFLLVTLLKTVIRRTIGASRVFDVSPQT